VSGIEGFEGRDREEVVAFHYSGHSEVGAIPRRSGSVELNASSWKLTCICGHSRGTLTKHGVFVLLSGKLHTVPPGINGLGHNSVETTLVNL